MLTERMRRHLIPIATIVTLAVVIGGVGIDYGDCRENGVSGLTALGVSGAGRSHHDRHSGGCGAI